MDGATDRLQQDFISMFISPAPTWKKINDRWRFLQTIWTCCWPLLQKTLMMLTNWKQKNIKTSDCKTERWIFLVIGDQISCSSAQRAVKATGCIMHVYDCGENWPTCEQNTLKPRSGTTVQTSTIRVLQLQYTSGLIGLFWECPPNKHQWVSWLGYSKHTGEVSTLSLKFELAAVTQMWRDLN